MKIGFHNGFIWTGSSNLACNGMLTITDGKISSVGILEEHLDQIVDLAGGALLPSFGDGHAHPMFGGFESMGPKIKGAANLQAILDEVARYARENPNLEWIVGASYESWHTENGDFDAKWLDAIVPDRPVVLKSNDYHTVWCNTAALDAAGITDETPNPPIGWIVRRADGSAMGTLREWDAIDLVLKQAPVRTLDEMVEAISIGANTMSASGITWIQDAWVDPGMPEAYIEALRRDQLNIRINLGLRANPSSWRTQIQWFVEVRELVGASAQLTANTIKIFADGVIEGHTAALAEAYTDFPTQHGMPVWNWDEMTQCVVAIDALGFQPHIHAIGDEALHQALNAIETAQLINGELSHERPVITHVQLLNPKDLHRFAELGVVANFEALWACDDLLQRELTAPRLGAEREMWQYPIKSLIETGARISMGSDWPVSSQSPLSAMSVAVTRKEPGHAHSEPWNPAERITLLEAITAYTEGSAFQAGQEAIWGSLSVGKSADLVWLSHNPENVVVENLGEIKVLGTWCRGIQIYRSNQSAPER